MAMVETFDLDELDRSRTFDFRGCVLLEPAEFDYLLSEAREALRLRREFPEAFTSAEEDAPEGTRCGFPHLSVGPLEVQGPRLCERCGSEAGASGSVSISIWRRDRERIRGLREELGRLADAAQQALDGWDMRAPRKVLESAVTFVRGFLAGDAKREEG